MARARMVSATGLACAAAIGAAPRMMTPTAPADATDPMLAPASDRAAAVTWSRSRQLAGDAATLAGSGSAAGARVRAR